MDDLMNSVIGTDGVIRIDMDGVEPVGGFEPLPVGSYVVEVSAAKAGLSARSKSPQLQLEFTVLEPASHAGRKQFHQFSLLAQSRGFLAYGLIMLGLPREDVLKKGFSLDPAKLVGARTGIVVIHNVGKSDDKNTPPRVFSNVERLIPIAQVTGIAAEQPKPPVAGEETTDAGDEAVEALFN